MVSYFFPVLVILVFRLCGLLTSALSLQQDSSVRTSHPGFLEAKDLYDARWMLRC